MLTACARSTEDVDGKIGRIDFNVDGIIHFRIDVDRGEGGVTARIGVKGAFTHQTMNAGLGAQRAVRPLALNKERAGLDAGDFTRCFFFKGDLKALAFGVAHIHAFEHACPVLSFRAARTGLNFQIAVGRVHRLVEHALKFELSNFVLDAVYILSDNFEGIEILFGQRKFKEFARIGDALRKTVEAADDIVEHLLFFAYFLGVFGIIPEVRVLNFPIYFFEAPSFAVDVKDTPEVH